MVRRSFIAGLVGAIGFGRAKASETVTRFPPVPTWHPSFEQPLDEVVGRVNYYTNGKKDFVVFTHGTCIILEDGLSDAGASAFALKTLAEILGFHPDMNPAAMDDGNILVRYNHPAVNVVLNAVAKTHWSEIQKMHLEGLTKSEVLITPLGPNKFDDFGKQALLGRAYMFMDAQYPKIKAIHRHR